MSPGTNSTMLPFSHILTPNNHLISPGPVVEQNPGERENDYLGLACERKEAFCS